MKLAMLTRLALLALLTGALAAVAGFVLLP